MCSSCLRLIHGKSLCAHGKYNFTFCLQCVENFWIISYHISLFMYGLCVCNVTTWINFILRKFEAGEVERGFSSLLAINYKTCLQENFLFVCCFYRTLRFTCLRQKHLNGYEERRVVRWFFRRNNCTWHK